MLHRTPFCLAILTLTAACASSGPTPEELAAAEAAEAQRHAHADENLLEVVTAAGTFGRLLTAIAIAEAEAELTGSEPRTLLAPTDTAFEALPEDIRNELESAAGGARAREVLAHHLAAGAHWTESLAEEGRLTVQDGAVLMVKIDEGTIRIEGVEVVRADVEASNGVLHIIDTVLLP